MSRRFALVGLSAISVCLAFDWAQGDQIFPAASKDAPLTSCQTGEGGGRCTRFEGYIVVRRHDATTAPEAAARPEAVLSANRLYLPTGDDKSP